MSKLIGTNPNQVPSNADLGTAAFMDKKEFLLSKGSEMSAIEAVISKTAVDVFIYDTTKDSDGGAWRKRTQHTSWYKEKLNTTTRGSRKEFPAVAVIVVESTKVTIYDGDDPDMPMWMVFNAVGDAFSSHGYIAATTSISTAQALNGQIVIGSFSGFGIFVIDFLKETSECLRFSDEAGLRGLHTNVGIVNRNTAIGEHQGTCRRLVGNDVHDLDMTVLPNAPIDYATGLPIPTIAVACANATQSGISVIKDAGDVVDITSTNSTYNYWDKVKFTKNNKLIIQANYQNTSNQLTHIVDFPTADVSANNVNARYAALNGRYYHGDSCTPRLSVSSFKPYVVPMQTDSIAFGHRQDHFGGLNLIAEEPETQSGQTSDSAMCYITSSFNSGWMVGNTKLATLSSTDVGDITSSGNTNVLAGKTFLNNGSFPYETFTTSGLNITSAINTTAYGAVNTTWTATLGKTYTAYFNLTLNSGTAPILFVQTSSSYGNGVSYQTVNGANSFTFTATMSTSSYFSFSVSNGVATNFSVANLEMYEGGVANLMDNPLARHSGVSVFGTAKKIPVASGADLMAYSGFDTNNYLQQSYDSNLDFGTGNFSVMGWIKPESDIGNYASIIGRIASANTETTAWSLRMGKAAGTYYFYSNNSSIITTGNVILYGVWKFLVATRRNGVLYFYIDGVLQTQGAMTNSVTNTSAKVIIGQDATYGTGSSGLALWRISATAPSAEQIKTIYEDEKQLFLENAKCTLYGTSSTITGLAYDDETELLHVGTSAGRSDFHGLRRINNTTRAIGTAISAVDGFIVEE